VILVVASLGLPQWPSGRATDEPGNEHDRLLSDGRHADEGPAAGTCSTLLIVISI